MVRWGSGTVIAGSGMVGGIPADLLDVTLPAYPEGGASWRSGEAAAGDE
jgi:hypothetical protein